MFSKAIVRSPGRSLVHGLTTANLGKPDYGKALQQHQAYIDALKACGLGVIVLDADEAHPDSVFVEDTALLTPHCAILMRPGAPTRRGEVAGMREVVRQFYSDIEEIKAPGTAEAGDILMAGDHFYIGVSERTNEDGANYIIQILNRYGMSGSTVQLENVLHLKTGIAYLENNNLMVAGEFVDNSEFDSFEKIVIPEKESYAANCIWVNGNVIMPSGNPVAKQKIVEAGYSVIEVDMSEFQKLDGGVSCLSLRF